MNSSQNEQFFRQVCRKHQNTHFVFNKVSLNSCFLWDNVKKMIETDRSQMTL